MKKTFAAATIAALIGISAPVSAALAYDSMPLRAAPLTMDRDDLTTGSLNDGESTWRQYGCMPSSGTASNANQPERAVKQYGQTSGGHACN